MTIDELMDLDPLELSTQNIEDIITYHRKQRQMYELGVKPKKGASEEVTLDLAKLGLAKPAPVVKRRI